ncbi:MAG: hypothetical protein GX471_01440 [Candidatus Microthrix parvicella]|jgi:hypothetical protein|nr:hypothetical protein [Candidatus Microthrix sp.]NLH64839.1 hypothetical protein [Candidatus Microthrix parvicella]
MVDPIGSAKSNRVETSSCAGLGRIVRSSFMGLNRNPQAKALARALGASALLAPLALSGVSTAGASPAGPSPEPDPSIDDPQVSYTITAERYLDEAANEELGKVEESILGAVDSARFGGLWLTAEGDETGVTVGIVGPTSRDREVLEALDLPVDVSVVESTRSAASLREEAGSINERLLEAGIDASAVRYDFKTGLIYLSVGSNVNDEDLASVQDTWEADWVVYEGRQEIGMTYPDPSASGVREFHETSPGYYGACTAGFSGAVNGGAKVQFTAAHCATGAGKAVNASHGDANVSGNIASYYGSGTVWSPTGANQLDVMLHSSPNASPHVYINSNYKRTVVGQANPVWLETNICYRGATSASEKCGGVSYFSNFNVGGRTFDGFCLGGAKPLGGDSGSGMYKKLSNDRASARGILWGYQGSNGCGTSINDDSAFMGALVLTG